MISKIIAERRAVFPVQYTSEAISKEELVQLLEAAHWAPTHRRTEPWRFKVFSSEASRKELSKFLGSTYERTTAKPSERKHQKIMEKPMQSACVVAVCMQRDPKESVPEWEEIAATAMAVQNMWLLAHSMNIGMYWSTPALKDFMGEHIHLDEREQCLGFIYMGKFEGTLPKGLRNTAIEDTTVWY